MSRVGRHEQITVHSKHQFDETIQRYLAAGYGPQMMTSDVAVLFRRGDQARLGCAFWFFVVVFFPIAIIMAIVQANKPGDSRVTIRLEAAPAIVLPKPQDFLAAMPETLRMSEDQKFWWDGAIWVDASEVTPPMADKSADGRLWWDGEEWRAAR